MLTDKILIRLSKKGGTNEEQKGVEDNSNESLKHNSKYQQWFTRGKNLPKLEIEDSNVSNKKGGMKFRASVKRPKTAVVIKRRKKYTKKGLRFDKIIPREYYENLEEKKMVVAPFLTKNYNQVFERPLSVVNYCQKPYLKKQKKVFKGIDVDEYIKVQSNNVEHKSYIPNYSKMHTRPSDDGKYLPTHMKGIVSRDIDKIITEGSLKMNNYSKGEMKGNYNTFIPKQSFNKMVNLSMMNSKVLLGIEHLKKMKMLNEKDKNVLQSLNFYERHFKELLLEGTTKKFDNITFKHINSKYEEFK
jgi:hypothetical protein